MKYKATGLMVLVALAASGAVVYASNNVSAMKFLGGRA
jgi:hypothetical protein